MKIRIKDNSIRYRLAQNEVTELVEEGEVWGSCSFPTGNLKYGLVATNTTDIHSFIEGGTITTHIPKSFITNWDKDQRVGFNLKTDQFYILIEKDWQCLKPREHEDESNLYKHPAG